MPARLVFCLELSTLTTSLRAGLDAYDKHWQHLNGDPEDRGIKEDVGNDSMPLSRSVAASAVKLNATPKAATRGASWSFFQHVSTTWTGVRHESSPSIPLPW